ncbi:Hypothetical predicted protein [Olea europaea subsp. europaea]|uniref:Uncharacterized protein n=1 Tax=Olea europaea subsp. europaea TaxID=158383 RepID=A0A8S0U9F1_OLEEU|nr:Hypothetical predicted protein [Olea europaea subsp. europaea]
MAFYTSIYLIFGKGFDKNGVDAAVRFGNGDRNPDVRTSCSGSFLSIVNVSPEHAGGLFFAKQKRQQWLIEEEELQRPEKGKNAASCCSARRMAK